jgi:hypothetical protein
VSLGVTGINHFFILSLEGMMANIPICHRDCNLNNPAQPLDIASVKVVADAEQVFLCSELIFDENAISREDATVCPLCRRKFPVWWLL